MSAQDSIIQERLKELFFYNPITGVFVRLVDAPRARAGSLAGIKATCHGYAKIRLDGKQYLAHRLAWLYQFGTFPNGEIDHINGVRNDNRIVNLRVANKSENQQNLKRARCNSVTGLLGVTKCRGLYRATIGINGKVHFLGRYETPEEAHNAYLLAKRCKHPFGELSV